MIIKILSFIIAFVLIYFIGKKVDTYIQKISKLKVTDGDDKELIEKMDKVFFVPLKEREPNKHLGLGERILFFIAFYYNQPLIVGSWLAFKLASKWQIWNTIIKIPSDLKFAESHKEFEIRNRYGTNLLQRWLLGTLFNLLIGFAGRIAAVTFQSLF